MKPKTGYLASQRLGPLATIQPGGVRQLNGV